MKEERMENPGTPELTAKHWRNQKLIASELRKLREESGMSRGELAEKMGNGYTEELIAQYEDGGQIVMETWPVIDMLAALHADPSMVDPNRLLARLCSTNGYADLTDESREAVDRIIRVILDGQSRNP